MSAFSAEERRLEELEFEDEVRGGQNARTYDELRELDLSMTALREALRLRAFAERQGAREEETP